MVIRHTLFRDQVLSDRERKNLAILDIITKSGPVTRTEISRITKLNIVTVSNYVNSYIDKDLVVEKGFDVSTGGRKPTLVELNAKQGYVIGIDIGPINMTSIITDLANTVVGKIRKPRPAGPMNEVITSSIEMVYEIINKSKIDKNKLKGVGLGVSGVIDAVAGTVRDTDIARGQTTGSYVSVKSMLEKEFNIPTFAGNDATVAAFGEKRLGLEQEVNDMLYIYSDVGCGIIIKGEIYCGAGGSAGELQLSIDTANAEKFTYWKKEPAYLRPWGVDLGITNEAKKILSKEKAASKIIDLAGGNIDDINIDMVIEAAKAEDKIALELLENAGQHLGMRIAYLINLFNPEVVIIGGGVERAGELFLGPIRRAVRGLAFEEPANAVKIIPSRLGDSAVALGAAALVLREIFAQM
ncbi:MAG: ROK family protein [Candidatus Omnitrophota bacterium]|nr:MAG: ROK family protein [Candidatus Omnitrophota bacterium]